jgi:hypothetical protein
MSRTAALAHSPTNNTATATAASTTAASVSAVPLAVGSGAVAHAGTTVYASSQHRVGAGGGMLIRGPLQYASNDANNSSSTNKNSSSAAAVAHTVVSPPASPTTAKPVVAVVTAVAAPAVLNAASTSAKRASVAFTMPVTATSNSIGDAPGGRATVAALFSRGSGA